jgi:hypothetical protein
MPVQKGSKPLLRLYRTLPYGVQIKFISVLRIRIGFSANPGTGSKNLFTLNFLLFYNKLSPGLHEERLSSGEAHRPQKKTFAIRNNYITRTVLWSILPTWIRM